MDRALLGGLVSIESQRACIKSRSLTNARGMKGLDEILDDREGGVPETELERAFERVLRRFQIARPDRQVKVGARRVDYLYADAKLWVEVSGRKDHGREPVFENDHFRHNEIALELTDYVHLRFTFNQVTKEQPTLPAPSSGG